MSLVCAVRCVGAEDWARKAGLIGGCCPVMVAVVCAGRMSH